MLFCDASFMGFVAGGKALPKGIYLLWLLISWATASKKLQRIYIRIIFLKGNHCIARFWTRAFPSSRCFHRISKGSSRATWRRLPRATLNEPSCFASAWSVHFHVCE